MSPSPLQHLGYWRRLLHKRVPGQVVVQYTTRCNARCAQCGMRVTNATPRMTLPKGDVRRLIDAMAERGVASISFTGGEPMLYARDVAELARYAGDAGIRYVRTGTNGYMFRHHDRPDFRDRMERLADVLADSPLNTFWVSLDSAVPEVHEENRGLPGMVEGLRKAVPIFHDRGLYLSANLGINRLTGGRGLVPDAGIPFDRERFTEAFRIAFHRFYSMVAELGITIVNACYPMSLDTGGEQNEAVYAATSTEALIRFTAEEKAAMFRALYDVIPLYRDRLRIFTPRSALLALMRQQCGLDKGMFPCRGGIDFFFVNAADRNVYPCGYRGGESLGKMWDLDLSALDRRQICEKCDWECFRDPSVLLKPILNMIENPFTFQGKLPGHRDFLKVWWEDVRYYRACGWFDARTPPDRQQLARFKADPAVWNTEQDPPEGLGSLG